MKKTTSIWNRIIRKYFKNIIISSVLIGVLSSTVNFVIVYVKYNKQEYKIQTDAQPRAVQPRANNISGFFKESNKK